MGRKWAWFLASWVFLFFAGFVLATMQAGRVRRELAGDLRKIQRDMREAQAMGKAVRHD